MYVQGVENVYTQHTPLLVNTLEMLMKGRLKEADYPPMGQPANGSAAAPTRAPKLVVVFVVGGTTYEESKAVAELNNQVGSSISYSSLQGNLLCTKESTEMNAL